MSPIFDRGHISGRRCDDVNVVNHDDLIARLRALSNQPVDDRVAHAHLERATAAAAAGSGHRRRALLAACVGALILPAAGIVAARASGTDDEPAGVVDQPVNTDQFACTGPKSEETANGQAQAREYAEWRAINCPSGDTTTSVAVGGTIANAACSGPPAFAGTSAEPADPRTSVIPAPRAAEAAALAETRSGCPATTSTMVTTTTARVDSAQAIPTSSAAVAPGAIIEPTGPPDGVPAGSPDSVQGTPQGVPGGHLSGVPGPPEGVAPGPPEGVPGPPAGAPGPPDGAPAGPPNGVPGPPDGVPAGPPDDVAGNGGGRGG
jgi:hypothetical protein